MTDFDKQHAEWDRPIKNTRAGRVGWLFFRMGTIGLRLLGWRVDHQIPPFPKFVAIVEPHTSNWDWPLAMLISFALRIKGHFLIKHTVFQSCFKGFFRFLGGIPVERTSPHGRVAHAVAAFERSEVMALGLAPSGTRRYTDHLRTGFYRIALQANVPIVLGYLDYAKKVGGIGGWFMPSGDVAADLKVIRDFYAAVTPRHPKWRSDVRFKEETAQEGG